MTIFIVINDKCTKYMKQQAELQLLLDILLLELLIIRSYRCSLTLAPHLTAFTSKCLLLQSSNDNLLS